MDWAETNGQGRLAEATASGIAYRFEILIPAGCDICDRLCAALSAKAPYPTAHPTRFSAVPILAVGLTASSAPVIFSSGALFCWLLFNRGLDMNKNVPNVGTLLQNHVLHLVRQSVCFENGHLRIDMDMEIKKIAKS
jgi:hypothetical protein